MYSKYRSLNSNLRVMSTIVMPLSDVAFYITVKASFCFFRYIYNIQMFKVLSTSPVMRPFFISPFCYDFLYSQLSSL